ncbi:N-acetylmuramoyl-L-alanine amidase [Lysinibacillus telephonicus]|uniref:N-acetylmuramoyl-L-alanine amidase n=1 Tax=Lysinibacillus telephonicus TaxID=1714840 RepID=A0A3S0HJ46_9BACI|nr:N-acetylmuramoyl-L-alanine amidase [Lysinibacillus telephonicus]RTQ93186.1 N-acetylmuramoyl-L-alanine amidase [Lysinibacillus telephonicus]
MSIKKVSLFVVVFFMSMFTIHNVSASQRFVDVPSSHGAYEEINYLVDLGVIKGYTENGKSYYKPNNYVTRGQAAKMVVESTGHEPLVVSNSSFSDIKIDLYPELSGYVESAVKLGFFTEYSAGKFAPNRPLTRNEMAKTLSKAFNLDVEKYANLTVPFTDISPKDPYYKYIAAIYYNGITKGNETGTKFNPNEPVKRSQFASFIARSAEEKYRLDLPVQGVTVPNEEDAIGTVKSTTDNLNVRSSATSSTSANIIGKVNTGAKLPVFEVEGSWLKVSYNGRYAYISSSYTQFLDQDGQPVGSVKKEVLANASEVIFYKTRDINGKELGSFSNGEKIKVYKTVGNWYLTIQNGIPGYVRISQTKEIEPVEEEPNEEQPPNVDDNQDNELTTNTIGMATVDSLHIRSEASSSSKSLGTINRGTYVEVHSISGNWAKISYNGIDGYTHKTYLRLINQSGSAVAGRIIVLDPGHGGKDPGTSKSGAIEKEIVLKVATKVKQKLEAAGAKVYMTRAGDTYPTLQDRVDFAQNNYAEVFVSIHVNSASSESASGTETYYSISGNENEKEDYRLASAINSQIVNNAGMVDRGVRREDYFVVRNLLLPSVLVELGFVTNASDREKLISSEYVDIFADSIYKGIVQYYKK